jgi:hypothetical protein
MNPNVKWGAPGLVLALAGAALAATEITHGIETGHYLPVAYGSAVVVATLVGILLIAPSFRSSA